VQHNNRAACDENIGLPCDIMEELSKMLVSLGRRMAAPSQQPIGMATVSELLDISIGRMIEAPHHMSEGMETEQQVEFESEDNEYENDNGVFGGDVEVGEVEPLPLLTLDEARLYASRSYGFEGVNN